MYCRSTQKLKLRLDILSERGLCGENSNGNLQKKLTEFKYQVSFPEKIVGYLLQGC